VGAKRNIPGHETRHLEAPEQQSYAIVSRLYHIIFLGRSTVVHRVTLSIMDKDLETGGPTFRDIPSK